MLGGCIFGTLPSSARRPRCGSALCSEEVLSLRQNKHPCEPAAPHPVAEPRRAVGARTTALGGDDRAEGTAGARTEEVGAILVV